MELFSSADDSSDDDEEADDSAAEVATVVRRVVRERRNLRVRCVGDGGRALLAALEVRESNEAAVDVLVVAAKSRRDDLDAVVRGGVVAVLDESCPPPREPDFVAVTTALKSSWRVYRKRLATADAVGCPPRGPADAAEHDRAEAIAATANASAALRESGVVLLPGFCRPDVADHLARRALDRFEACRTALLANHAVDVLRPGENGRECGSFRELASREDLRFDVRLTHDDGDSLPDECLRAARRICRDAAHTDSALRAGNFGRWNFDDGGPIAPKKLPVVTGRGAVVSLPGAAEQALHADAPHLFDHLTLPGHYFNLFVGAGDDPRAGQTAFALGTHDLAACAAAVADRSAVRLVRPRLRPGDALLFDARILHFGLPNRSARPRPLLYWNLTEPWFVDPKNWDDRRSVFSASSSEEDASCQRREFI